MLEDEGLVPMRVYASSAGALVTGLWTSGVSARRIRDELLLLRREWSRSSICAHFGRGMRACWRGERADTPVAYADNIPRSS